MPGLGLEGRVSIRLPHPRCAKIHQFCFRIPSEVLKLRNWETELESLK